MSKPTIRLLVLLCLLPLSSYGRTAPEALQDRSSQPISTASPAYCAANHNIGRLVMNITNYGRFASDATALKGNSDCFTGEILVACEFPKRSRTQYSFQAAFWIGAIVGRDTLVSTGADGWLTFDELHPNEQPFGNLIRRSIIDPESSEFEDAVSEQDYIAVYYDTFTSGVAGLNPDEITGQSHTPIGIEITQRSYAWSYPYAEDFVLFDYGIRNVGHQRIRDLFMGLYVDADVHPSGDAGPGAQDDLCGFRETQEFTYGAAQCTATDTVFIAWISDNDGDFDNLNSPTGGVTVPDVTATRIVRTPSDELTVSFNWWISNTNATLDFGPQSRSKLRIYNHGGTGTPAGDRQKYFALSNGEFDYDQIYTAAIEPTDPYWVEPPQANALTWSQGLDTRYLLSFGPFDIDPGQNLPVSLAYVAGEGFHTDEENWNDNLANQAVYDPDAFYSNLDFNDLGLNSRWASWVYDNPGINSDDDDYVGEYRVCCAVVDSIIWKYTIDSTVTPPDTTDSNQIVFGQSCDTIYYQGDGVPDFRGASPPPAPEIWLEPTIGKITVRWNGLRSENTRDVFSRELDFEGYRVYLARDDRETSYSLMASYDREDFNKLVYSSERGEWQLLEAPFTRDQLVLLYSDGMPGWMPETYTRNNPLLFGSDSLFAFEPQDFNQSEPGVSTPIAKRYPDAPKPPVLEPDSIPVDQRDLYLTEDGRFKFYEYEYEIENLLPTVPYFVNVTAFDYGSPSSGLPSLETSKTVNAKTAFALHTSETAQALGEEIYVWPNPYRGDADYLAQGFEGRFSQFSNPIPDRERRIHFANLPPRATIKIYSLDGDLVSEFEHDKASSDPTSMHAEWDMITRNTQAVVSGIYYWVVEAEDGKTTIGKLVIIR
jgi:hypothetical protein